MSGASQALPAPAPIRAPRHLAFWGGALLLALALLAALRWLGNDYAYFAGYFILQYVVLATAWNILGGYAGYVNFGAAGFVAAGLHAGLLQVAFDPGDRALAVDAGQDRRGHGRQRELHFDAVDLGLQHARIGQAFDPAVAARSQHRHHR